MVFDGNQSKHKVKLLRDLGCTLYFLDMINS